MKIKLIIKLIVLLFISCDNSSEIKKELKILQSKSIIIPTTMNVFLRGKDTIINEFMDSEFKLIVYTDSIACNTCAIGQMHMWNGLLNYTKRHNNRLKYYFIFSPKKNDNNSVILALKTNNLDYPVILDVEGEFEKLNTHLPRNKTLHTFLLDKDNKVILVGNPLNNPKIEEMFYKIVEERLGKK